MEEILINAIYVILAIAVIVGCLLLRIIKLFVFACRDVWLHLSTNEELYECVLVRIQKNPSKTVQHFLHSRLIGWIMDLNSRTAEERFYNRCKILLDIVIESEGATMSTHHYGENLLRTHWHLIQDLPELLRQPFEKFLLDGEQLTEGGISPLTYRVSKKDKAVTEFTQTDEEQQEIISVLKPLREEMRYSRTLKVRFVTRRSGGARRRRKWHGLEFSKK